MCNPNKKILCRCNSVEKGQDYWKLSRRDESTIIGPPMPHAGDLYSGITDKATLMKVTKHEEDWLNSGNPFDFNFKPKALDSLGFFIGGRWFEYIYDGQRWQYQNPHNSIIQF